MVIFEVVWPSAVEGKENRERFYEKERAEKRAREVSRTRQPNDTRIEVVRVEEDDEVGRTIPVGVSAWRGGEEVPL
jgi:hypothetical protein